ncbi:MAG: UDP-N-acetylmuramoyl-L-alanyl-D-glutamate--2,6-diaminopimelate ligase [Helicobacter trogontum]|uniref:UDP-N-acetylmuramoyl-L-alanyl-D-glutamate--2, 6-diaminopimelate ligase n=1 Tax=Helicobacter trogontum TaxID=50960 RepID=UPI00243181A9|nr:UDP-N-acetylmuramoyl-L-alanyl-D-glutamate--2,6-diaminopimelate ligase [Helicobacter trogontum]MCI5786243.1 UDP-N-acetylmuramoyl-L-alanyl-D-glutamate--2,6-diaminopimelate ligase [Helicobacter trogontum]
MSLHITDDTRQLKQDSIFLRTPQNEEFMESLPPNIRIIERDELTDYFKTDIKIIGITGTNGKTTTAAAIYSVLLDMGYKVALLGTRGMFINDVRKKPKGLTTPSLLELYEDIDVAATLGCDFFVMEVSSHAIKQERIYGLNFCLKILTNITSDHLDYHKTWEDYAKTKLQFLQSGECPKIINLDDKSGASIRFYPHVLTYGVESKGNLSVNAYGLQDGIFAQINLRLHKQKDSKQYDDISKRECVLESELFGLFNLYNLMAATLAIHAITNKDLQTICTYIKNFGGVSGRMEIVSKQPLVIVDFAHTTDGMQQVFEAFKTRNISVVFGAGGDRDVSKRQKMGACARLYAKNIYITNDNPRSENPLSIAQEIARGVFNGVDIQEDIKENTHYKLQLKGTALNVQIVLDRAEAIRLALQELPKDWILLILGKGDENVQIFKDNEVHFSDKECVQTILNSNY